jgi:acetyl esterase/lipase
MSSRHLIDPELLAGLDELPAVTFSAEILPAIRTQMAALRALRETPVLGEIEVYKDGLAGPDGNDIGVIVHRPKQAAALMPMLLHIHGGGYLIGDAAMCIPTNQQMAFDLGAVVVSVDYRLAPETCHPGPVEDCYAALKWMHKAAADLGGDPARIAVTGESAGGGLAAAVALLARDRGEVRIVHQNLIYPMIDDRTGTGDLHPWCGEFVWTPASNRFGWESLLGNAPGGAGVSPYAAAARADNLAGLPDTYIAVGALDLFVEEDIDYARRLIRAGVSTELHVYPGAYHGFDKSVEAAVVNAAARNRLAALRRALA